MRILARSFLFLVIFASPLLGVKAQINGPAIVSPRPGEVLQGSVKVVGSTDLTGFVSAELAFAYADDPTGTWFLFATLTKPVLQQSLAPLDTTSITDGNYSVRLRVYLKDGTSREIIVTGLRVRNYSPVETPTPAPQATPLSTSTPTATPFPTPTALPLNPAVLVPLDLSASLAVGGLVVLVIFGLIGIYLWVRRKLK